MPTLFLRGTAANITASETLYRLSVVIDLLWFGGVVVLSWALYVVLAGVDRNLALLGAFLRLVENAILAVITLNGFVALRLLSNSEYLRAVDTDHLQALARVFLSIYASGLNLGFVFLRLGSVVFSYLWFVSQYVPRPLAAWGIFASTVLTLLTLAIMVFPDLGGVLGLAYMMPMGLYEVGLGAWLLVRGLNARSS
jgi:hypothetical protein